METKEMTKIDKNIPFPVRREGKGYPWHRLNIGESFEYHENIRAAQAAALYYTQTTKKTFKARTADYIVRVWRIK